jgi:hypothetical protein
MSDISNLSNIFNFNTYQEILNAITSINIYFDWNIMNTKQPINTNLNLDINTSNYTYLKDKEQRKLCNIYINKCKIKYLFNKYKRNDQVEPKIFDINTLNEILFCSICNNNNEDKTIEYYDLINLGASLSIRDDNIFTKI